jgi:hypothetical protein
MVSRYPQDTKPISKTEALEIARSQFVEAYETRYGAFEPLNGAAAPGAPYEETEGLRRAITSLSVVSENDRFYIVEFVWEFMIDKYTSNVYYFYNGNVMSFGKFDPKNPNALTFPG